MGDEEEMKNTMISYITTDLTQQDNVEDASLRDKSIIIWTSLHRYQPPS